MKTLMILVALCGFACGKEFEGGSPTCERLVVDAVFITTATKNQTTIDRRTVRTSDKTYSTGECSNSSSTLAITFNDTDAKWTLVFTTKEETVNVRMMFHYEAQQMFPGKGLNDTVLASQVGNLQLSTSNKSFKCESQLPIEFESFNMSGIIYTVSLTMKNLQVQAFNLPEEKFSEATVCDKDRLASTTEENTTTEEQTTMEESTTEESSTTEEPSSAASAATTTVAPEPNVNTYTVKDGNETCLKMTAAISLSVAYTTKDNKTATAKFSVPKSYTTSGSCGNGSESNSTLTVKFDNNTIDFIFTDSEGKAEIEPVTVMVMQDATNFPNAMKPNQMMTLKSASVYPLSDDTTFFMCKNGDIIKLSGDSSLDLSQLQVQAFNLKNDNFTGTGVDCAADKTTTALSSTTTTLSSTTSSPTSTTPSSSTNPPVNTFMVKEGNVTCLLMKASFVLDITYMTKNGSTSVSVTVPSLETNTSSNGTCGNVTETLDITFFEDWKISFIVGETDTDGLGDDEDLGATVKNYAITNVSLTFTYDGHLPNANKSGQTDVAHATNLKNFKAPVDGSYKCSAKTVISTDNGVEIDLSNFQFQAFQTKPNHDNFNTGNLNECEADTETNSIVPIAVGAALAGLVVIVLIAYLIGRRKSRRAGYESV